MSSVLSFVSVTKRFGAVEAVSGLDLQVPRGSVTVILGPNGAGKTTTIRLATGVFQADEGAIRVFGLDPRERGRVVRQRCGVVPPKPAMYDRLSGRDNLRYAARLYRLDDAPIDDLAERFGIRQALDQLVGGYSTGMRTRLALARSLLHDPQLLLLDEPTAGLDPESAFAVRELVFEMARGGKTVVMSTHLLHEADGTADQIVMMNGGSAWEAGTPDELIARHWDRVEVRLETTDPSHLDEAVVGHPVTIVDGHATVVLDERGQIPELVARLVAAGASVRRVEPVTPTLERLYFAMRQKIGAVAPFVESGGRFEA